MPTKTMEVLQLQEQGSKIFVDAILTTHERVVQVSILGETWTVFASPGSFLYIFPPSTKPVSSSSLPLEWWWSAGFSSWSLHLSLCNPFPLWNLIHSLDLSNCHYISKMPRFPVLISRLNFKSDIHLSTGLFHGVFHRCPALNAYKLIVEELFPCL